VALERTAAATPEIHMMDRSWSVSDRYGLRPGLRQGNSHPDPGILCLRLMPGQRHMFGHRWWPALPSLCSREGSSAVGDRLSERCPPVRRLEGGGARDLPFFASFEADPDLAGRAEEILEAELGR
jgi:hypothetical protein